MLNNSKTYDCYGGHLNSNNWTSTLEIMCVWTGWLYRRPWMQGWTNSEPKNTWSQNTKIN